MGKCDMKNSLYYFLMKAPNTEINPCYGVRAQAMLEQRARSRNGTQARHDFHRLDPAPRSHSKRRSEAVWQITCGKK